MANIILMNNYIYKGKGKYKMLDISKEKKYAIEQKVRSKLSQFGCDPFLQNNDLIVDIVRFVKNDGFIVQTSEMDPDTTGCLIVNDIEPVMDTNKNRLIVVNKHFDNVNDDDDLLKKSRFITAHEYGHFVLHKAEGSPIYAHRDTAHRAETKELEADYFARAILMPFHIFSRYVSAMKDLELFGNRVETTALLSNIFKVTKDKVNKRLRDLEELSEEDSELS